MFELLLIGVCGLVTEAITEIIVKSNIFIFIRDYLDKRSRESSLFEFLSDLLACGHCTSVWVAFFIGLILTISGVTLLNKFVDWFILWILIHRLSNVIHFCIDFIDNARRCSKG